MLSSVSFSPCSKHQSLKVSTFPAPFRLHIRPLNDTPIDILSPFSKPSPTTNAFSLFCNSASERAFSISRPTCIRYLSSLPMCTFNPTFLSFILLTLWKVLNTSIPFINVGSRPSSPTTHLAISLKTLLLSELLIYNRFLLSSQNNTK